MRLFIAVAADEEVKAAAAEVVARLRRIDGYRWVDPRDMHATLRFFGETAEDGLPKVEALMRAAAAKTKPFSLTYSGVGAFDSLEDPRVVWMGVGAGKAELEAASDLVGRDEPRPYAPHVTLGRRRKDVTPAGFVDALKAEPALSLVRPVTKLSLYASRPAPFGHAYEILAEADLAG